MTSASGTPAPAIARPGAADENTVHEVIHAFSQKGLTALTLSGREAVPA